MALGLINPITDQPLDGSKRWLDGYIWDRDPTGEGTAITAGQEVTYFSTPRGTSSKTIMDTNLTLAGKLPDSWEMLIWNVGLWLPPNMSDVDAEHYNSETTLSLDINGTTVREAPSFCYQSGFGLSGFGQTTSTDTTEEMFQNGPVGAAGVRPLSIPIHLVAGMTFTATVRHDAAITLAAAAQIMVICHGWIGQSIVV